MCSASYLLQPTVARRRPEDRGGDAGKITTASSSSTEMSCSATTTTTTLLNRLWWRYRRRRRSTQCPCQTLIFFILLSAASTTSSSRVQQPLQPHLASYIQFTQSTYHASIPENSLGKVYVTPEEKMGIALPSADNGTASASDLNGLSIRFRIKSGDPEDFFKAEAERVGDFVFLTLRTRSSNLNVLNRERTDAYRLDVRAKVRRRGDKKRVRGVPDAKCVVVVSVTDTNDLDPFFQPSSYAFDVPEDTPLHASVGRVHADDADSGVNGEIYYSLMQTPPEMRDERPVFFAVDPVSGVVTLTRPVSFKERPHHQLTVVAEDRGPKPAYASRQADTASVQINIRQVRF